MNKGRKIKRACKRKMDSRNYCGYPPNLRVHPLPSHPVEEFSMIKIFVTSNLNPRPPNNIYIQSQDSTSLSLQQESSPHPMMKFSQTNKIALHYL
jgi:hypothetical protein